MALPDEMPDERPLEDKADIPGSDLDAEEIRRYGRHLVLPEVGLEGQRRLKAARVLLVGAGGLGSPAGLYLAAAGVGTLGIVDFDRVDTSNLQRQVLYGQDDVGRFKVEAAVERLRQINPHIRLVPHAERFALDNARELVERYDVIVDGSDNFTARYLLNDACVLAGKPDVWGAVARFEGQVSVFRGDRGPCYRCLFPEPPPAHLVPNCAEGGVLGVLPGIVGSLQANEVLKLLLGIGEPLLGRFVIFDALRMSFREIALRKNPDCPVCRPGGRRELVEERRVPCDVQSGEPSLSESEDLNQESAMSQEIPFEITVETLKEWLDEERDLLLLDVREPHEYQICRLEGSRLVPLRQLPHQLEELDTETLMVVYCHHGPRSSHAVTYMRNQGFSRATNLGGGIDAWSLRIDGSVARY